MPSRSSTRWRSAALILSAVLVVGIVRYGRAPSAAIQPSSAQRIVCDIRFSPHGGCTDAIVGTLREAKQTVLMQAYSFTSEPIANALIAAKRRGASVKVILDKSQLAERYSVAGQLMASGILVRIDYAHAIAHNKVIVIDGRTVLTGSFNFTRGAEERNAENLLILRDANVAVQYAENWRAHWGHSQPYVQ